MALQPKEFNIPPGGLKTTLKVSPAAWEPRVLFCWLLSLGLAPSGALGMPPSALPRLSCRFCLFPQTNSLHSSPSGGRVAGFCLRSESRHQK